MTKYFIRVPSVGDEFANISRAYSRLHGVPIAAAQEAVAKAYPSLYYRAMSQRRGRASPEEMEKASEAAAAAERWSRCQACRDGSVEQKMACSHPGVY